ncbi:Rsm10 [Kluyveromyces lactis]|nr:Rsm10 [Kluyveromyces lactis]
MNMFRQTSRSFVRYQSTTPLNHKILPFNAKETPIPKCVEAVYHAPLKIEPTHRDLIADIQLRSYDNENLDFFSSFVLRAGYYLGIPMKGPKPLPTKRKRWTVIRAPFVMAKSKENFERHTHARLIRLYDCNTELVETLLSYISKHGISGVGIKCNLYQREPIDLDSKKDGSELENIDISSQLQGLDDVVGAKVVELLNNPEFKKHLK